MHLPRRQCTHFAIPTMVFADPPLQCSSTAGTILQEAKVDAPPEPDSASEPALNFRNTGPTLHTASHLAQPSILLSIINCLKKTFSVLGRHHFVDDTHQASEIRGLGARAVQPRNRGSPLREIVAQASLANAKLAIACHSWASILDPWCGHGVRGNGQEILVPGNLPEAEDQSPTRHYEDEHIDHQS
ncbi:hypothetical protein CC86DRAFT_345692 [Ophiobolus disseminans]|uniref:Uncharacterized protein n=1 Tax=Ophiobolus disseminans TaxID=1469910 RepID=A0A6A7A988_9PLEO|nr:hypothetical protein CC86DRAFT_345692 [Ophiobolus disseminans]